jgi:hypothetical protein
MDFFYQLVLGASSMELMNQAERLGRYHDKGNLGAGRLENSVEDSRRTPGVLEKFSASRVS